VHSQNSLSNGMDRYIGAIGGIERVKSNWEDIQPCALIEGMIVSMSYLLSHP
jgi:hypothetical protein